ncbi:Rhomboid family protein [Limimonas halophila]|uniref:Rhomboid family protein n=1 Tax=Limimonas halophila TaxID=1082479 RepID=A0A1G7Q4X3_9PROT|nr:rhomboid family intramembrane serine protease [Limimonas halophila]SDF93551.1 Rhomboid family protein [Limimonas halophila]
MDDRDTPIFVEVAHLPARDPASERSLVLAAAGIRCYLAPRADGVAVMVPLADAERARAELDAYARENAPTRKTLTPQGPGRYGVEAALGVGALLAFLFAADHQFAFAVPWFEAGAADAAKIRDGEVWRLVTALGLHADAGHLLSNLAFGTVAWTLSGGALGTGVAWLATILAGFLGNGVSALVHGVPHTAVGASTAVFGALGLLAAVAGKRRMAAAEPLRVRRWAPLAAGVMLMALLGVTGERTDIVAHIAGFAVGSGLGMAAGRLPLARLARVPVQLAAGSTAAAIFAGSWALAIWA